MHIDKCPKCGQPGHLTKKPRRILGRLYGPYLAVEHYAGKTPTGSTRLRQCHISISKLKLAGDEMARIRRLLAKEGASVYRRTMEIERGRERSEEE